MTSDVSICNLALSEIGNRAQMITSLEEDSAEANQCALWYDTLRKRLLRTAPWGFCRYQTNLAQLGDLLPDNTSPFPWLYKYAHPADCLKMRYIIAPPPVNVGTASVVAPQVGLSTPACWWQGASRANRFVIASDTDANGQRRNVVLSNVFQAIGVYNGDVTDPALFDELFVGALASALAYKIVIPLNGNVGEREQMRKSAEDAILQARVADGNEAIPRSDVQVDWIDTRGVGPYYGAYGAMGGVGPTGWGQWCGSWDSMSWGM